jgi:hypothetical protein
MEKMNPFHKKMLIIIAAATAALVVFMLFVYVPGKNTIARMKAELRETEDKIRDIETLFGKSKTIAETFELLDKRRQELDAKFPQKEEETLRIITDYARKMNIEVTSIKPQAKTAVACDDGRIVSVDGRTCQKTFVTIEMKCLYQDLVRYCEVWRRDSPAFVSVEGLKIARARSDKPGLLDVTLELNLYMLS